MYVSDMRETFLGRCTTEEEENQSEMLGGRNFSNWKEFENRIEIRFFFLISILQNQSETNRFYLKFDKLKVNRIDRPN